MSEEINIPTLITTKPKRKYTKKEGKVYGRPKGSTKKSEECEKTVNSEKEAVIKQDGIN